MESFARVLDGYYVQRGRTLTQAVAAVHLDTGVALGSIWRAVRGKRVAPETAERLRAWAFAKHGIEDLDTQALVMAPSAGRKARGRA